MSLRKGKVSAILVQGNPAQMLMTALMAQLEGGTGTVKEQKTPSYSKAVSCFF